MRALALFLIAFALVTLSGCAVIGAIFKAGAITALIALLILIVIVVMLIRLITG